MIASAHGSPEAGDAVDRAGSAMLAPSSVGTSELKGDDRMICASCGTENRIGAKFCTECGTALAAGCPTCGYVNLPNAKFCSECATRLQPGTPALRAAAGREEAPDSPSAPLPGLADPTAERRLVTVLFADLVGFTSFAEGRDAEEVRELQARYFGPSRRYRPLWRQDREVHRRRGHGPLGRAARVRGRRRTRGSRRSRPGRGGARARGGNRGSRRHPDRRGRRHVGATNQGMVAGDMVNTASRLQSAAAPATVLVGEATQRAAAGAIAFEPAGDQVLKGKVSPVPAWRALRVVAQRGGAAGRRRSRRRSSAATRSCASSRTCSTRPTREGRRASCRVIGPGRHRQDRASPGSS